MLSVFDFVLVFAPEQITQTWFFYTVFFILSIWVSLHLAIKPIYNSPMCEWVCMYMMSLLGCIPASHPTYPWIGPTSTVTLTRIMHLLKMNEWIIWPDLIPGYFNVYAYALIYLFIYSFIEIALPVSNVTTYLCYFIYFSLYFK